MAWTKEKTVKYFRLTRGLSFFFVVLAIGLLLYNFLVNNYNAQWTTSFPYLMGSTFGNGLGCGMFRICHSKKTWPHALLHTLVLILMLVGHREIFELVIHDKWNKCFNKYAVSMLTILLYLLQYILSYCFVVFARGKTSPERVFRSGLHAFLGALIFFINVLDGVLVCHRMARDSGLHHEVSFHLATISVLIYGVCTWYLLLNPYFDWRRLRLLLESDTKEYLDDAPSSTSLRRPSRTLRRN